MYYWDLKSLPNSSNSDICIPESNQSIESILSFEHIEDERVSAKKKRYDEEILRAFEDGNIYLFAGLCIERVMLYGVDGGKHVHS